MKKEGYKFFTLLSFIFTANFVNANSLSSNLAQGSYGAAEIIRSAFAPFFGALLGTTGNLLFENILIFFVIFCIVFMVVKRIEVLKSNRAVVMIVSLSASILAARFMTVQMILTVLLTYQTLGVVLTAFLPIIVGFVFIQSFPEAVIRKMFWIFFAVVFFALWDLKYSELGPISWIYFWSAIVSLIFFVFDGTIRRALMRQKMIEAGVKSNLEFARKIREELEDINRQYTRGIIDENEYKDLKKRYTGHLKDLAKF